MKVAALIATADAFATRIDIDQDAIIKQYFRRELSDEIENDLPGLPDDIANYRDDSGCMILVGAGTTTQKAKYQIGKDLTGMTFASCASACMKSKECRAVGYAAKAKKCQLFSDRFFELRDANHVVMKVSDGSLWYDRVCISKSADYKETVESLNALNIAFHSYHLARRVNGYGDEPICKAAKALVTGGGITIYSVKPADNNTMLTSQVIARCKTCGLRPGCYSYKYNHTYWQPECGNVDKFFQAVGYPSGGSNGWKEMHRVLAKKLCGNDNVSACGNSKKLTACGAIRGWSSGSACCPMGGWCNAGNNDRPSSGYTDMCAFIPGAMDGYTNTRD